jgi:Arm DNA-binding domain
MPLTDTAIRNAKPGEKPVRLFDGGGLYLEVSPTGGKWWRLKYRFNGKEKRLSLGVYPDVSLKDARDRRDASRKLLADRKAIKRAANSFEVVAREWFAKYSASWAANHSDRIIRRFERDIFPWIGGRPIAEATAPVSKWKDCGSNRNRFSPWPLAARTGTRASICARPMAG